SIASLFARRRTSIGVMGSALLSRRRGRELRSPALAVDLGRGHADLAVSTADPAPAAERPARALAARHAAVLCLTRHADPPIVTGSPGLTSGPGAPVARPPASWRSGRSRLMDRPRPRPRARSSAPSFRPA